MKVTVKVPSELAARARARGLKLETYIEDLLAERAGSAAAGDRQPRSPREIRSWLDSLAEFSEKIPPLPDTITREWIYQEHD